MYSDTIADMLTRIRNGYMAKKSQVLMPYSKNKQAIANILIEQNYLKDMEVSEDGIKKTLVLNLLYKNRKPAITKIISISKSGRRIYKKSNDLPYVLSGYGEALISTSQGVMTATQARKRSLGGEVICKIW